MHCSCNFTNINWVTLTTNSDQTEEQQQLTNTNRTKFPSLFGRINVTVVDSPIAESNLLLGIAMARETTINKVPHVTQILIAACNKIKLIFISIHTRKTQIPSINITTGNIVSFHTCV